MKYVSDVLQARVRLGQDAAYRELSSKAVTAQTEVASALGQIQARLAAVGRVASRNFLTICLMKILTISDQRGLTPQAAEGWIR